MEDISIDFIKEIGEYDDAFAHILQTKEVEYMREEITAYTRDSEKKNSERIHEWRRIYWDIVRLKEKISEQREEIHARVTSYGVSSDEYDEIIVDADLQKRPARLMRFFEERMSEIQSTLLASGGFDRQVRSLSEPDEMFAMRKNIYIDRKNITEALSVILVEDIQSKQIVRSLLYEKAKISHIHSDNPIDQPIEIIFEKSLKEMALILSLIEEYQQRGLQEIRRLDEFDRQIIYMLTALALKKHE